MEFFTDAQISLYAFNNNYYMKVENNFTDEYTLVCITSTACLNLAETLEIQVIKSNPNTTEKTAL